MKLDQFLKWKGLVSTGGEAKYLIKSGKILVNNTIELRRGRQLIDGDLVVFGKLEIIFSSSGYERP